ncbi:MAG: ArsR/SmtB family transcription factor [Dehalococcoidales bacterium]
MQDLIRAMKALSDETRLRIVGVLLSTDKSLCVCEIMDALNEFQYNVSRHLKELKMAGLLKETKEGRWVYYSIAEPADEFQRFLFKAVCSIPREVFQEDRKRLEARLSLREGDKCVVGLNSEAWERLLMELS